MSTRRINGDWDTRNVYVDGKFLDPRPSLRVFRHSPAGFNWSYDGSGPAQLALALLMLATDQSTAVRLHQDFKRDIITDLPQDDFDIRIDLEAWIEKRIQERKQQIPYWA